MTRKTRHLGSSFQDFLAGEGLADDANAHAIKRVVAWQIEQAMQAQRITKVWPAAGLMDVEISLFEPSVRTPLG